MERKDLTGYRFTDDGGFSYRVLAGYEGSEIVYEECDKNTPLCFCCDVKIVDSKLKGSYLVSYTVTKEDFFTEIEGFCEEKKKDATTIASALREKYYKIPTLFLRLVGEVYLKGETRSSQPFGKKCWVRAIGRLFRKHIYILWAT